MIAAVGSLFTGLIFFNVTSNLEIGRDLHSVLPAVCVSPNLVIFLSLFKVKHAYDSKTLSVYEIARRKYTVYHFWVADIVANAIMLVSYLPAMIIPFFLIGWPVASFPFLLLVNYTVRIYPFTSE